LLGPDFITLLVRDLDVSRKFYAQILELPESPEKRPNQYADHPARRVVDPELLANGFLVGEQGGRDGLPEQAHGGRLGASPDEWVRIPFYSVSLAAAINLEVELRHRGWRRADSTIKGHRRRARDPAARPTGGGSRRSAGRPRPYVERCLRPWPYGIM
jgi:catechol 2,3-dioxygenase-like lactoylglutathione lyase family enzyme